MIFTELTDLLKNEFPNLIVLDDNVLEIPRDELFQFCVFLHHNEALYFDQLACITGFDNHPKETTLEVIYNFYSIPFEHSLALKVKIESDEQKIPSLCEIWKGANWLEREVYDLFGIVFDNHPDLRRILLPANWEGYPLRKDYKVQEYFHGIKVEY